LIVVAKMGSVYSSLVFMPPNPSTYEENEYNELRLIPGSFGRVVPAFFIKHTTEAPDDDYVVIFAHGNGEDIGCSYHDYVRLSKSLGINLIAYDYCGYGLNTGQPSEHKCYEDIRTVFDFLTESLKISSDQVILCGRSLGSGSVTHLAEQLSHEGKPVAGLVLLSGISSCVKVVSKSLSYVPGIDMFCNYKKIGNVLSPSLIIHGDADEVVPYDHGRSNAELAKNLYEFLPLNGIGHNDIYRQYDIWSAKFREFVDLIKSGALKPLEPAPTTKWFSFSSFTGKISAFKNFQGKAKRKSKW